MMINGIDPVLSALRGLSCPAPAGLSAKVFTRWVATPSPLGELYVAFTGTGVQFVRTAESVDGDPAAFAEAYRRRFARPLRTADRAPAGLLPALRGRRGTGLLLDLSALSDFERDVLAATRGIPAGETRPYGWVAREAGRPRAAHAVGSVLARNPVPLLVPCHRVVRADGRLGEYLFGPAHKEKLLRGEDANLDDVLAYARQGMHYLGSDTTGVVCFPTCHQARRITPSHRHGFRTLADAAAAGYRPCRVCRPAVDAA
ncbi:methylated-DNA--[protein]-cysteine S-methyltransferase [Pseudonocardia adelaidensis]|uniref:Methylated-DNA--[protein]-cysteine S-methyltransferase n=1 Tax=Pseudonocardia adelaidensis TaxID=648754 RepID=A0ABP9P705_9PSEU